MMADEMDRIEVRLKAFGAPAGPWPCGICGRVFHGLTVVPVFGDDDFGVCGLCLEAGPEAVRERLRERSDTLTRLAGCEWVMPSPAELQEEVEDREDMARSAEELNDQDVDRGLRDMLGDEDER